MQLIIFDLDFTLWDAGGTWCDHTQPPYHIKNDKAYDSEGLCITLYPDVKYMLEHLKQQGYEMGIASRTGEPNWAHQLIKLFNIEHYFTYQEIYPASKIKHFEQIAAQSGIDYKNMLFFDDEYRNITDVASLGVNAVYVPNGINKQLITSNIHKY